jgi:hypothetical protein
MAGQSRDRSAKRPFTQDWDRVACRIVARAPPGCQHGRSLHAGFAGTHPRAHRVLRSLTLITPDEAPVIAASAIVNDPF